MWFGLPASAQVNSPYAKKLAPYVSSPQRIVERMLELASPRAGETLFDLGCGDGRVIITAAQNYKVMAVGVEINDKLVQLTTDRINKLGLGEHAKILHANFMDVDLSGADIVVLYLLTETNQQLRPRLEKFLKPGARVVSHDYAVPGWEPKEVDRSDPRGHRIYLYQVGYRK
jgi:cyclopropane fatty-acyl-phospholipid synthase-like methyltransferase